MERTELWLDVRLLPPFMARFHVEHKLFMNISEVTYIQSVNYNLTP